jgi:hypothetical protein
MLSSMPGRVTFCEHSTIVEAWATIWGRPAPVRDEDTGALVFAAKREFTQLTREPAVVAAKIPDADVVPPFWSQQWSWDRGRYTARLGHQFLSVHFLAGPDTHYDTFDNSMAGALRGWFRAMAIVYRDRDFTNPADRVAFGYMNEFAFPGEGFDASEWFKYNVGIDMPGIDSGLLNLDLKFAFADPGSNAVIALEIHTEADHADSDRVRVRTKIAAQTMMIHEFLDDPDGLERVIRQVKDVAKDAFFEFTTAKTHQKMGAQYASD